MGQILVRNLDDGAVERLKARAAEQKISLERLVRDAIHDLASPSSDETWAEAERLRKRIGPVRGNSTTLIRKDRDARR